MANRWIDLGVRAVLTIGLLYCAWLAGGKALARWYFHQPGLEGTRTAIALDPDNAMYHAGLARALERSTQVPNLNEVIQLYQQATRLSPYRARYWAELGGAYEHSDRLEQARDAYEHAQRLFPNSPEINWTLANFYLRQGEVEPALGALKKVVLGDAALRAAAFDLVWRAGVDASEIRASMLPPDPVVLLQYLSYLARRNHLDEAGAVWTQLIALNVPLVPRATFPYLDALLRDHKVAELKAAWRALEEQNPVVLRQRGFDTNLVTNGDFEGEILNGGLDWRVSAVEGVVVSIDSLVFFDGTRSLKIRLDGKHNVNYRHIVQYVPVQPDTSYRFMGYMRAEGVTTDSGPRFDIFDAYEISNLFLSTESLVGTSGWAPQQLEFKTGPETTLLAIRIARPPSSKLDNQIAGTVWVDRVSLNPGD